MGLWNDKRGIELSMNVIIISIILVIVLVIIVLFFTGGASNFIERVKGLIGTQTIDYSTAQLKCNTYCSNSDSNPNDLTWKKNFCGSSPGTRFDIDTNGDGKADRTQISCSELGVSCSSIQCNA